MHEIGIPIRIGVGRHAWCSVGRTRTPRVPFGEGGRRSTFENGQLRKNKTKPKKAAKLALTINSCDLKVKRSGYGLAICRWTQHRVVLLDASFETVRYALLAVFVAAPPVECKAILQPRNFSRVSHCQLFIYECTCTGCVAQLPHTDGRGRRGRTCMDACDDARIVFKTDVTGGTAAIT